MVAGRLVAGSLQNTKVGPGISVGRRSGVKTISDLVLLQLLLHIWSWSGFHNKTIIMMVYLCTGACVFIISTTV
jgi:hypothetical protein